MKAVLIYNLLHPRPVMSYNKNEDISIGEEKGSKISKFNLFEVTA